MKVNEGTIELQIQITSEMYYNIWLGQNKRALL